MTPWIIGAVIWLTGALISFRWEARNLVTRENYRRAKAIRQARDEALFWPIRLIAVTLEISWKVAKALVLSGIPESKADRDEAIKRLEDEVLGASAQDARDEAAGQLHLSLQEALNGTTAAEEVDEGRAQDMTYLDRLERTGGVCGPDTRLPSGKTMGRISPAYRPRGYSPTHRPDYPRRNAAPDTHAAVANARRALELLRRLAAMGANKDPFTGARIQHAIRDARHHLQDAESGHMTAATVQGLRRQVTQLERLVRSHEAIKDDDKAKVCTRCGCPVVQGRLGYIHIPTLGGPSACHSATIAPEAAVPWYLTPADSPEREAVRRRTEESLRQADEDRATAATMAELQAEFPIPLEPDVITSISLDGTETQLQVNRFVEALGTQGYVIGYHAEGELPTYNGMVTRKIRQTNERITEWFEDSTLPVTRKIHKDKHADAPNDLCPFCQMNKL